MTDRPIVYKTSLRVWPGGRGEGDPSYLAQALGTPFNWQGGETIVVRVQFTEGPRTGGTDHIALTHVEVVDGVLRDGQASFPDNKARAEKHLPTLAEARAGREAGVAQSDDHANDEWKAAARASVEFLAAHRDRFVSDDIWDHLAAHYPDVTTHEPRALGAIMRGAVRDDVIRLASCKACGTSKVVQLGRARAAHASDVAVYESVARRPIADPGDPKAVALAAAVQAQRDYEVAQDRRRQAIADANLAGNAYRVIADGMGLSVGNVHALKNGGGK